MLKRATAVALALLVPIASGTFASGTVASAQATKVAAGHKKPKPKPKPKPVPSVTLNGAGASSIEPFFSPVFYRVPPVSPEGHGQLRPGR